jgi:hypothetical protein
MSKKEIFKSNLKSITIWFFNGRNTFEYLQDNFIDYADKYGIQENILDQIWNKSLDYYLKVKELEEMPSYTEQQEAINNIFKILD